MITFNQLYETFFQKITKDVSDVELAKALINDKNQEIIGMKDWFFMEKERTAPSVAAQYKYRVPVDCQTITSIWVESGGITYYPVEVTDQEAWRQLTTTPVTSNITSHFTVLEDFVQFYPTFSDATCTIHMVYRRSAPEMTIDDYSTGLANSSIGTTTVTGTGTVWLDSMEGSFIELNGLWYEIYDVVSNTSLTTLKPVIKTISGASHTIGQMSPIPGEYHDLIWKGAVADWFEFKGIDTKWQLLYASRLKQFTAQYGSGQKTTGQVLRRMNRGRTSLSNPNDYPTALH